MGWVTGARHSGLLLLVAACGGIHAPPIGNNSSNVPASQPAPPAPENTDGGKGQPAPEAPPAPPAPTASFAAIRSSIFVRSCLDCHSSGGRAARVPLETHEDLVNSPRDLVLPGNAEESGLWIALTRQDAKKMPPPDAPPLSAAELDMIKQWITEGAKP